MVSVHAFAFSVVIIVSRLSVGFIGIGVVGGVMWEFVVGCGYVVVGVSGCVVVVGNMGGCGRCGCGVYFGCIEGSNRSVSDYVC